MRLVCVQCGGQLSEKTARHFVYNYRHARRAGKTPGGPYCSRDCFYGAARTKIDVEGELRARGVVVGSDLDAGRTHAG